CTPNIPSLGFAIIPSGSFSGAESRLPQKQDRRNESPELDKNQSRGLEREDRSFARLVFSRSPRLASIVWSRCLSHDRFSAPPCVLSSRSSDASLVALCPRLSLPGKRGNARLVYHRDPFQSPLARLVL